MSTLTSSPSPAASPTYRPQPQPSTPASPSTRVLAAAASPSHFLRRYSAQSPRSAFNAPIVAPSSRHPTRERPSAESSGEAVAAKSTTTTTTTSVDVGTQYSPPGSPPTSNRTVAPSAVKPPGSAGSAASTKKRKEATRSQSPPGQMSASQTNSTAAAPAQATNEPNLRVDPDEAENSRTENEAESSAAQTEPQEARSTHGHSSAPKRSRPEPGTTKIMPVKYETCSPKDLGVLVANMLMELIRLNDQIPLRDGRLTRFHSRAPPGISVSDYLQRLIQHATLSPPILLSMVYYIDRLCALYPAFTVNSLTVHRFLITAATVAAKGLSDSFWTNPTYARIGGIPVSELATLELEFLQKVQWKIVPKPEVLEDYYASLVDRTAGFELEGTSNVSSPQDSEDDEMNDEPT